MNRVGDVAPDETVLRRFDPVNPHHFTKNEGAGPDRLSSGALLFDSDGCSVHREAILRRIGLSPSDVWEGPYKRVAGLVVGDAVSLQFAVVPDPWPNGQASRPEIDEAHALITEPRAVGLGRNAWRRARSQLAQRFVILPA